ncbi:hypothetical protein F7725_025947 [Dissostichus mawsoni]|uniref:Uncharacterized protein n=1 Tax=Dissostichus mawsoni TaxID=36200 RepID=A0A7J5X5P9_DISMA|nr:hypothetical protein F7725_025947 [Dissostichus mawsoni]
MRSCREEILSRCRSESRWVLSFQGSRLDCVQMNLQGSDHQLLLYLPPAELLHNKRDDFKKISRFYARL